MFPICPKCDIQLVALVFKGIEADMCPECRGFWLDQGELEDLLDRTGARAYGPALDWCDAKTPGKGKDEVRLAYVIESAKLERAARLLLIALDKFKG